MSTLRISDAPLLPDVDGTEKIPTGGRGDYAISVDQIKYHIFQDVGKELVGLGNVDNTSDLDKPVSTAQQAALNLKAEKTYVDTNLDLKADKTNVYTRSETTLALSKKADLVNGVIPENQIPSSFNDVLEFTTTNLPIVGESGKIYVTTDNNKTWRWGGNKYVEIAGWNPDSVSKKVTLPTYYTKEAGVDPVTGVAEGAYFSVHSTEDDTMLVEYQNVGGVPATTGKSYPSASLVNTLADDLLNLEQMIVNPASGKPSADKIFTANGENLQDVTDLLLLGTVSTYVITPETHPDISDTLNSLPENSTVLVKNGNYTASGVRVEKNNFKIEMQDGVRLTLKAGADGLFLRFGKRGPSSDYNGDNLPQFNGTLDYWDESQYSPASEAYPRYENLGVSGGTIILDNSGGIGSETGVDFYRCNNPILETTVKWKSKFAFGNAVRVHFCKNMISSYLNIDDNENSTYTMLYYWSYGLRAGTWDIGAGQDTSIDFKHSVDGYVRTLKCRGSGGICTAVNFGYGSINNTVDRLEARNGSVRLKASEEFDLTRDVVINDLDIENAGAEGLVIAHVAGLKVGKFNIRAKTPIYLSVIQFYKFSSNRSITPVQSTAEYAFDGNYRTSETSGGITKYFEKRAYPLLKNANFGKGVLTATTGATYVILANVVGGVADLMGSNGKLRRFDAGQIPVNGYQESFRTTFKYDYTAPNSIENVDFGDITLNAENNASSIVAMVLFSVPISNSTGTLRTNADKKSLDFIWMFDSDITLHTNKYLMNPAGFMVEMNSMVRSKLDGKWLANGRVFNFKGGNTTFYLDGYVGHELAGEIIRQSAPAAVPPLLTNYSNPTNTWKPINLRGLKIYAEDGSSCLTDSDIIRHNGSLPTGVSTALGAGYVCDQGCMIDQNRPFRRTFTGTTADVAPTLTPNFVGELALNSTTNTWWKANGASTWSKL